MSDLANAVQEGVTITSELAAAAAPIVAVYNPAAGAAIAALAPLVSKFILTETQVIADLNKDMTRDEVIKALQDSKSANWGITPLETPTATGA